jgi:hypothetical protein
MPLPPYAIYNQQLSSLCLGYALWEPDPGKLYDQVSVGDVGYIRDGYFIRMFNVLPPRDDHSNTRVGELEPHDRMEVHDDPFNNIRTSTFGKETYYSRYVTTRGQARDSE